MTDSTLVEKLKGKAGKDMSFPAMLNAYKDEIAKALPKHLDADRMCRIGLTCFRRNPKLAECDPRSVFAALVTASQLGLEPDTLGRAYLIPYGRECNFVPGWKGLVDLFHRSGQGTLWTGAVYQGDTFDFALGDSPYVKHVPSGEYREDRLRYVYAVARPKGCEWPIIEAWTIERVLAHRDRYNRVGRRHYSFDNAEMYARKVVCLQALKYCSLSPELVTALELSHAAESPEGQGLTIEGTLEGSWAPPPAEEENGSSSPANRSQSTTAADAGAARAPVSHQATQNPQASAPSPPEWPKLGEDGLWRDSTGADYQPTMHGWNSEEKRPSVTVAGVFRARRRSGQGEAVEVKQVPVKQIPIVQTPIVGATTAAHERATMVQQRRERGEHEEEGW